LEDEMDDNQKQSQGPAEKQAPNSTLEVDSRAIIAEYEDQLAKAKLRAIAAADDDDDDAMELARGDVRRIQAEIELRQKEEQVKAEAPQAPTLDPVIEFPTEKMADQAMTHPETAITSPVSTTSGTTTSPAPMPSGVATPVSTPSETSSPTPDPVIERPSLGGPLFGSTPDPIIERDQPQIKKSVESEKVINLGWPSIVGAGLVIAVAVVLLYIGGTFLVKGAKVAVGPAESTTKPSVSPEVLAAITKLAEQVESVEKSIETAFAPATEPGESPPQQVEIVGTVQVETRGMTSATRPIQPSSSPIPNNRPNRSSEPPPVTIPAEPPPPPPTCAEISDPRERRRCEIWVERR
jgi:hypothetical protein